MGYLKYVQNAWKKPETVNKNALEWRKQLATTRLEHPTRVDRARSLGYRAKQGIIIVRQRVDRGGHHSSKPAGGRRPKRYGRMMPLRKSYQIIAEQRANKQYPNCEILNSYWVGKDGRHYWFDIILVDRAHPQVKADKSLKWITEKRGRVYRGLTSASRESSRRN